MAFLLNVISFAEVDPLAAPVSDLWSPVAELRGATYTLAEFTPAEVTSVLLVLQKVHVQVQN